MYVEKDGNVLLDNRTTRSESCEQKDISLDLKLVYDFATTAPVGEIDFILKAKDYNLKAAEDSLKGNYGHCLGKTMNRPLSHGIFGDSIYSHIIAKTASACDARMGGAMIPVMSNSGSGNQGICATNPVLYMLLENNNTEEELVRAFNFKSLNRYLYQTKSWKAFLLCVVVWWLR